MFEIGGLDGLSSFFILDSLTNTTINCVDTCHGVDEHRLGEPNIQGYLSSIESRFDKNLKKFKS